MAPSQFQPKTLTIHVGYYTPLLLQPIPWRSTLKLAQENLACLQAMTQRYPSWGSNVDTRKFN